MASLRDGWETYKARLGPTYVIFIVFAIVYMILSAAGFMVGFTSAQALESGEPGPFYWVFQIVSTIVGIALSGGLSYSALKIVRGEDVPVGTLFSGFPKLVPLVVASLITGIVVAIGFVLLVVPGIVAAFGLSQAILLVMDRGLSGVDAVKASWQMMKGYRLALLVLSIVTMVVVLLSLIPLGLGLIVSVPVVTLASAAFYNRVLAANPPSIA